MMLGFPKVSFCLRGKVYTWGFDSDFGMTCRMRSVSGALQSMWMVCCRAHVDGHEAIPIRILQHSKWRIIITSP